MSRELLDAGEEYGLDYAELVSKASGVPVHEMLGKHRHAPIARARHVAIWMTRQHTELGFADVGRLFGRDHATAMHSCRVVEAALAGAGGDVRLAALARSVCDGLVAGDVAVLRSSMGAP